MNEMVERVAIALYAADGFLLTMYSDPAASWAADRGGVQENYRKRARSAIAALREPTEAMRIAGLECGPDQSCDTYWEAMIDAALAP